MKVVPKSSYYFLVDDWLTGWYHLCCRHQLFTRVCLGLTCWYNQTRGPEGTFWNMAYLHKYWPECTAYRHQLRAGQWHEVRWGIQLVWHEEKCVATCVCLHTDNQWWKVTKDIYSSTLPISSLRYLYTCLEFSFYTSPLLHFKSSQVLFIKPKFANLTQKFRDSMDLLFGKGKATLHADLLRPIIFIQVYSAAIITFVLWVHPNSSGERSIQILYFNKSASITV